MRNKEKHIIRVIFPLFALLLLSAWPLAYAYDVGGDSVGLEPVQVMTAETRVQPTWTIYGKAIGSIESGELFHIDAVDNPADITVALNITNSDELIHSYKYLILRVGIYVETYDGAWEEVSGADGEALPETYISLQNAQVRFALPGLARYKVAIDGGSFYCVNANPPEGGISPRFYLDVG